MNLELVVTMFDGEDAAKGAYETVRKLQKDGVLDIDILDAAMIAKRSDGTVQVHDTQDVDAPRGGFFGIIAGGLIGLVGGPAGAVMGAVAGGATGALSADLIDGGFSREELQFIERQLTPGTSALLVLIEEIWQDNLDAILASYEGTSMRRTLTGLTVDDLATAYAALDAARADEQRAWEAAVAEIDADLALLDRQLEREADGLAAEIVFDTKMAQLRAKRDARRQELHDTMQARIGKLEAAITERRAHLAAANEQSKAHLDSQIATFQARLTAAQQKLEASYKAQQDEWQKDIDSLKARAALATADTKAKLDAEVAALQAKRDAARLEWEQRKAATAAAASDLKAGVSSAHDDLQAGRDEARDDLKRAREKAAGEYK